MKKEDWSKGIDNLDDDVTDDYVLLKEKYAHRQALRKSAFSVAVSVASFCIVVGGIVALPMLQGPNATSQTTDSMGITVPPTTEDTDKSIPFIDGHILSGAPQYHGEENSVDGTNKTTAADIDPTGISVTAELVEVMPDTYTFFNDWRQTEYRLLKLKTVKRLKGTGIADEFYYLIPIDYMTDYTCYDRFVLSDMAQLFYDGAVIYNKTDGCAQRLSLVLFGNGIYDYHSLGATFAAYDSDGNFDIRLWKSNENWTRSTQMYCETYSVPLNEAEKRETEENRDDLFVRYIGGFEDNIQSVLQKYLSFESGIYVSNIRRRLLISKEKLFEATRYINGFATNETVRIIENDPYYNGEDNIEFSKAHFTEEDLAVLPNLSNAVASVAQAYAEGEITPPHIENYSQLTLRSYGIFGWYAKTQNGIIGVVRLTWCYDAPVPFLDDAYYIVEYSSDECKPVSRDDLLERIGDHETSYVFKGEYDREGKIYDYILV